MGHNNGIITKPINVRGDIAYVLGRSTGDVGQLCGDVDSVGAAVDVIKKFCWYKPIRQSSPGFDISTKSAGSDDLNGDMPVGAFWIGALEMPFANSLGTITSTTTSGVTKRVPSTDTFFYKLQRGLLDWLYQKPRGVGGGPSGADEWYRIKDFNGYNHNCVSPLPTSPSGIRVVSDTGNVTIQFSIPSANASNNMTLATMHVPATMVGTRPALSDFYGGLLFYKSDYSDCFWQTATAKLGTSSTESTNKKISLTGLAADKIGSWRVRPFLSLNPLTFCENPSENLQIFLAGEHAETSIGLLTQGQYGNVTVTNYSGKWIAVAQGNPTSCRTSFTLLNGTDYTVYLTNIKIEISYVGPGSQTKTFADTTIDTGDTKSFANVFTKVTYGFCNAEFSCDVTYGHTTTHITQGVRVTD